MKFCKECGYEISKESKFCKKCGTKIREEKIKEIHTNIKQRPTFLNVLLALMLIGTILPLLIIPSISQLIPSQYVTFYILLMGAYFICIYGLYNWKKWGFYGYIGISIISFILNVSMNITNPAFVLVSSFIGVLILWWAMKSVWGFFE